MSTSVTRRFAQMGHIGTDQAENARIFTTESATATAYKSTSPALDNLAPTHQDATRSESAEETQPAVSARLSVFPVDVNLEGIPAELRDYQQWMVWRPEEREDAKPTKVPMNAHIGKGRADVTNSGEWSTYDAAVARQSTDPNLGVGFALSDHDPFVLIDFDHCRDPKSGVIDAGVRVWVERFDSYAEVSASGEGIHVWVRGSLPPGVSGRRAREVEVYSAKRYATVTGERLPECPSTIESRQEALDALLAAYGMDRKTRPLDAGFEGEASPTMSDDEILEKLRNARNSEKFNQLWAGDLSMHGNDHSSADAALVAMIAFYTQDPEQIDRLFRASGLIRDKWLDRPEYRDWTIDLALSGLEEVYQPSMQWHVTIGDLEDSLSSERELRDAAPEEWNPPRPLPKPKLPSFPTHCMAPCLRSYVSALAIETQTPVDLAAMMTLAVMAAASAKKAHVKISPSWKKEPLNLYTAVALESGNRKSAVVNAVSEPIAEFEKELRANLPMLDAQRRIHLREAERSRKCKDEEFANSENDAERETLRLQLAALEVEVERLKQDTPTPKLSYVNASPEKLADMLAENGEKIAHLSDEGGVLSSIAGASHARAESMAIDLYLKTHDGGRYSTDRMTREGKALAAPLITIGISPQPGVLMRAGKVEEFMDRGLLNRFLFSLPESSLGTRHASPPALPTKLSEEYFALVTSVLELPDDDAPIILSDEALDAITRFSSRMEPRLASGADLHPIQGWASKLPGATVRIAGVFHLFETTNRGERIEGALLSEETMEAAIEIAESYLIPHAKVAFGLMRSTEGANTHRAEAVLNYLKKHPETTAFSVRDLYVSHFSTHMDPDSLTDALRFLADYGYVREQAKKPGTPGRPSKRFVVNPYLYERGGARATARRDYAA